MRKVYHNSSGLGTLPFAVAVGACMTATIFCVLPFSHMINKPSRTLELRKSATVDLPPPAEDHAPPPPPEAEQKQEAPPDPQLAEKPMDLPLVADLDVAAGSGGVLAGFGEVRGLAVAESTQQDAFDASELEKRPEPISQVPPAYPSELRKAKIEGLVTLAFILDAEGKVEDPRVEKSTRQEFEKPSIEAIKRWRFRPGMKDGKPVRTYVRIPMRFRVTSN